MYHQIAHNKRTSIVLIAGFLIVWLLAGFVIGLFGGGTSTAIVGAVVLGLLGIGAAAYSYYFGSATVLAAVGAREADPQQYQQLYNIVQTLAIGDGVPVPKVYIVDDPSPNAFATGRDPQHAAVSVTTGLLLIVTTMIGMAALIASFVWQGAFRIRTRDERAVLVILAIGIIFGLIAMIVGPIMQMALSRQRESLADASGVELTRNPQGLLSALKKIAQSDKPMEKFNHAVAAMCIDNPKEHHGSFFNHLFDSHPPIEERIAALEKIAAVQQT